MFPYNVKPDNRFILSFIIFVCLIFIIGLLVINILFPSFLRKPRAERIPIVPEDDSQHSKYRVVSYHLILSNSDDKAYLDIY